MTRLLIGWLTDRGYDCHRRNVGGVTREYKGNRRYISFSTKGECDWWFVLGDGRHVDLEVKRPGARPSIQQIMWMLRLNARGASAFYCDSLPILQKTIGHLEDGCHIYMNSDGSFDLAGSPDVARDRARRVLCEILASKEYHHLSKRQWFRDAVRGIVAC